MEEFVNPFRPGAGQPPPYLAGREHEKEELTHWKSSGEFKVACCALCFGLH